MNLNKTFEFHPSGNILCQRHKAYVWSYTLWNLKLYTKIVDLDKYCLLKAMYRCNYKQNCLYLALESGGLSDIKLQQIILTLRNPYISKAPKGNGIGAIGSKNWVWF